MFLKPNIKVYSIILAVAMLALSFPSYSLQAKYKASHEEAAVILEELGVLSGISGNFATKDSVTVAEASGIFSRLMGVEQLNSSDNGNGQFAEQYIKTLIEPIVGQNENMMPDQAITFEQAVAMLMCVMKYQPMAESMGGYPIGYITAAVPLGLVEGWNDSYSKPITGRAFAYMVYNAIDKPMMAWKSFEQGGKNVDIRQDSNHTILSEYLHLTRYTVRINQVKEQEERPMQIDADIINTDKTSERRVFFPKESLAKNISKNTIEGALSTIYVDVDDVIHALWQDSTTYFSYITDVNQSKRNPGAEQDSRLTSIMLAQGNVIFNVDPDDLYVEIDGVLQDTFVPAQLLGCFAKVMVSREGYVTSIKADTFDQTTNPIIRVSGIITEIRRGSIFYMSERAEELELREIIDIEHLLVLLDGKESSLGYLEQDMFFDCIYNKDEDSALLLVTGRKLNDIITEYSTNSFDAGGYIMVDGAEYNMSSYKYYISIDNRVSFQNSLDGLPTNVDAHIYLDGKREVRYIITNAGMRQGGFYGVIVESGRKDFSDHYLTILRGVRGRARRLEYTLKLDNSKATMEGERIRSYDQLLSEFHEVDNVEILSRKLQNLSMRTVFWFGLDGRGRINEIVKPSWLSYSNGDYMFRGRSMIHELDAAGRYSSSKVNEINNNHIGRYVRVNKLLTQEDTNVTSGLGQLAEMQYMVHIKDDTAIFSLTDREGNFNPTYYSIDEFAGSDPSAISIMIQSSKDQTASHNNAPEGRQILTDLIVICSGAYNMRQNYNSFSGISYVGRERRSYKILTEEEQEETLHQLSVEGRFGWNSDSAKYEITISDDRARGYDLFRYNVDDVPYNQAATGTLNPLRNKVTSSGFTILKNDRYNPSYSDYFIKLGDSQAVGNNTIISLAGLNTGTADLESLKEVGAFEIFNLDKLTTPGFTLGDNYPYAIHTVYRVEDEKYVYIGDDEFRTVSERLLVLKYNPNNISDPYQISSAKYMKTGDNVFFLYANVTQNNGKGELRAVIFQEN